MIAYRILRPDDARELATLHARAFETPWSPAALRGELAKPSTLGLGLQADGQDAIISFVLFQRGLDEAEILTLATDPDRRKKGFAKTLLQTGFDHLKQSGIARCFLEVAEDNSAALAVYHRLSFRVDGRRKHYYKRRNQSRVDALLMSKNFQLTD